MRIIACTLALLTIACHSPAAMAAPERPTGFAVIAHRGASGYLPEHTLAGAALAHAMGADYIELDVVLTRDGHLVVLHDLYLDAVTDVAARYPGRRRPDGRHYAIDFTLEEIRVLRVGERLGRNGKPEFPGRFPAGERMFTVPTLDEAVRLVQGLNRSTGREAGLYVEPKAPAWHRSEGKDLMAAVLERLAGHGYRTAADNLLLQSFDMEALRYARRELGSELRMVQLIGENRWRESPTDFDWLQTRKGLAEVAEYAQGIGPWLPQVAEMNANGTPDISDLVDNAHAAGLFGEIVRLLAGRVGLDGIFTDHPDQVIAALPGPGRPPAAIAEGVE